MRTSSVEQLILDMFAGHSTHEAHFTAQEVYNELKPRLPAVNPSTVYRALERMAQQNRARLDAAGVFANNVMASPGAGKTSLILKTIAALKGHCRIGVIEGDTASVTLDADKVLAAGMIQGALGSLPLDELDLVIVENVPNLGVLAVSHEAPLLERVCGRVIELEA